jgi:ferredoxin
MTYVITGNCNKCEFMDCLVLCPVDCFHEAENMLVINPEECTDCGVCEIECPSEAIVTDAAAGIGPWIEINRDLAEQWPIIARPPRPRNEWTSPGTTGLTP